MNKLKYAVIGTGAIGGYYGARLAQSGQEVCFLLHSDYDYVKANGLQVDSCDGSFHLDHPLVYRSTLDMPFNGMTVALKTQTDLLLKNLATRQLIYEQMMEVIGAAQHLGVKNLDESFAQKMLEMTDAMTPYSPSMRLDYDFHRPMEIHYIYTRPIQIAREAGFPMPRLAMLEAELKYLNDVIL